MATTDDQIDLVTGEPRRVIRLDEPPGETSGASPAGDRPRDDLREPGAWGRVPSPPRRRSGPPSTDEVLPAVGPVEAGDGWLPPEGTAPEEAAAERAGRPRYSSPRAVVVATLVALLTGLLLNAPDIRATAERQEFGWQRRVSVALISPVAWVADALHVDDPRQGLDVALGRAQPAPAEPDEPEPVAVDEPAEPADQAPAQEPSEPLPSEAVEPAVQRVASPADPLGLYIAGDSMVGQFGPALERLAESEGGDAVDGAVQFDFESGITRPDFIDWPARLRDVVADSDPDAMVLMFGGNDAQPLRTPDGILDTLTDEWKAEYAERVGGVMEEMSEGGRDVYWVGMPIVSSADFQGRVVQLNEIYAAQAERFDTVTYIDSQALFTGPSGGYEEYLADDTGDVVDMRLNDGIHFTTPGGERLADHVWGVITDQWEIEGAGADAEAGEENASA